MAKAFVPDAPFAPAFFLTNGVVCAGDGLDELAICCSWGLAGSGGAGGSESGTTSNGSSKAGTLGRGFFRGTLGAGIERLREDISQKRCNDDISLSYLGAGASGNDGCVSTSEDVVACREDSSLVCIGWIPS